MKNVVVTGGLGFIGSNFIRYILKTRRDIRVTNVDNESVGSNPLSLQDIIPGRHYRFVKGDLSDYQFTRRVLKRASIVVNFAAQTHVDRSIANAEPFFESNTRTVHCPSVTFKERFGVCNASVHVSLCGEIHHYARSLQHSPSELIIR